jgi:hypothetical protein
MPQTFDVVVPVPEGALKSAIQLLHYRQRELLQTDPDNHRREISELGDTVQALRHALKPPVVHTRAR